MMMLSVAVQHFLKNMHAAVGLNVNLTGMVIPLEIKLNGTRVKKHVRAPTVTIRRPKSREIIDVTSVLHKLTVTEIPLVLEMDIVSTMK